MAVVSQEDLREAVTALGTDSSLRLTLAHAAPSAPASVASSSVDEDLIRRIVAQSLATHQPPAPADPITIEPPAPADPAVEAPAPFEMPAPVAAPLENPTKGCKRSTWGSVAADLIDAQRDAPAAPADGVPSPQLPEEGEEAPAPSADPEPVPTGDHLQAPHTPNSISTPNP